jgi:hypothetical protein
MPNIGQVQRTRAFSPQGISASQAIHDMKWATRSIAAGVVPAATNFFGAAPNSDVTSDRYEQGNTLVSSGKNFYIYGILTQVFPGAAAVLTDLEKIVSTCHFRIVTAQKEYGCFPILTLPAGGGLAIQSGQVAVTPAVSPGALSVVAAVNGMPTREAAFTLARPLQIQANQAFYMELIGPTAGAVWGAQTLTGAVTIRVILDGVEERAAA